MGELGTIIQFVTQAAGPLGIVIWAVSKIISGMLSVLQPVIDSLLAPLVGILTIIGQTLGQLIVPVLKIFEPVLTLVVNMFVFFYNALRPVFELIHDVFSMIGAVVGKVVGTILYSIGKMLEFVDDLPVINIPNGYETMISQGSDLMNADIFEAFKKIDTSAVTKTGMSAISANNSGSNSSTYSGVRDVTVNNYFSGFVNGDEEKIALRIWEIIKRKDALNLT
jgi:phage-related protein